MSLKEITSKKRVLLIINPSSGPQKGKLTYYDIIDYYAGHDCVTTTMKTEGANDAADFVRQYGPENDLVVCCGGDGTLNEVITGMMSLEDRKPIGFLPCGSTNDMARTLKLPYKSLKKCRAVTLDGTPVPHDVGLFNGSRYFNYVCSFGAFTRVSYATPRWLKKSLGHFAYILDGIVSLGDIKPVHMQITLGDGTEIENDYIYGGVTNALSVGGLVKLKENDVALNDGIFEVMLIRNPKSASELQQILNGVLKQQFDDEYVRFLHTDKITFRPEKPVGWTVDGEFGGEPDEVTAECLHNAVSIMRRS